MANVVLQTRLRTWIDTKSNLSTNNPTPLNGELIIEVDGYSRRAKVGDGTTPYNNLPFLGSNVIVSELSPSASDFQYQLGTMWIRNNDNNTPSRCYYLESVSGSLATWRKVITDQDLSNFAALSHTHGNITNDGKLGSSPNKFLETGPNGVIIASDKNEAFNKSFEDSPSSIQMNGVASAGVSTTIPRADHRHPSDTSKINVSEKGAANGVATLGADQKIPAAQLPSYVDDVVEIVDFVAALPTSGLTVGQKYVKTSDNKIYTATTTTTFSAGVNADQGVIYTRLSNEQIYRWSGSAFISISNPLDLASQSEAESGIENTKAMTALRVFQSIYRWITTKQLSFFGSWTPQNNSIESSDTIPSALAKAQGQLNNKESLISAAAAVTTFNSSTDVLIIQVGGVTKKITGANAKAALGIYAADNVTIEVSGNTFRVKDLGITTNKIANNAVTKEKIASVAFRAITADGDVIILNGGNA